MSDPTITVSQDRMKQESVFVVTVPDTYWINADSLLKAKLRLFWWLFKLMAGIKINDPSVEEN